MNSKLKYFSKLDIQSQEIQENAMGTKQKILGIIYPKNTKEVQEIVLIANKQKIPLYPYSRGQNYGYGAKTPSHPGCLLVDLKKMNKIKEFDNQLGKIILEPGVTQGELYQFLKNTSWRADVSGAGTKSSIVGNCLEGGFGHTPKGNKRKELTNLEVVLGTGKIIKTGEFPGLGPDLSGAFVQSNFGIITALQLQLMKRTPINAFILTFKTHTKMINASAKIRNHLQENTLTSLVHIGNATRTLTTLKNVGRVSNKEAARILKDEFGVGDEWNCLGGIYGSKKEIHAKKKVLKKELKKYGKLLFFSEKKLAYLEYFATLLKLNKKLMLIKNLQDLHGLLEGRPTDAPLKNMQLEKNKLLWFSPVIDAKKSEIQKLLTIAEKTLLEFNYSFPLTLTFVTPTKLVGVISIQYPIKEKENAFACYKQLEERFSKAGISQYRKAVIGMENIDYKERKELLISLKRLFDPRGIISPGRYNIK